MQNRPLDRVLILNITIIVEAVLLLLATVWSQCGDIALLPLFHLNRKIVGLGLIAGVATASTGFILLWLANLSGSSVKWLTNLRTIVTDELMPLFQTLNTTDIVVVAASSGFCEEIFFRGVVQNQLGLWLAAVLFGFFHCPTPRHLPYGIWALCAGTFLGWLLLQTGSLWTPIIAHSMSNFLVLMLLRHGRQSATNEKDTTNAAPSSSSTSSASSQSVHKSPSVHQSPSAQSIQSVQSVKPVQPVQSVQSVQPVQSIQSIQSSQEIKTAEPPMTSSEQGDATNRANPKPTDKI